ncbi:hypothetical protein MRX96_041315 [Rhipicephalus microplus]
MKIFVNWTALDVLVDSLICISVVVLKSNLHNVKLLLNHLGAYSTFLVAKGTCAYLVRRYARARLEDSSSKAEKERENYHGTGIEATTSYIKSSSASECAASSPTRSLHHRAVKGSKHDFGESIFTDDLN